MSEAESNYEECYVAFLDLMGMKQLVKDCDKNKERYEKVIAALQEAKRTSAYQLDIRSLSTGESKSWKLQVQAFSDCVVLFIPTESYTLNWLLFSIRRLHDKLLRLDIAIRGSITIGGMHWNDNWSGSDEKTVEIAPIAFGSGLVEAYLLENDSAVYPRILISDKLYEHIINEGKLKSFPFGDSPLMNYCRQDMDGLFHLDVLHEDIKRNDVINKTTGINEDGQHFTKFEHDQTPFEEWLNQVRLFICNNLNTASGEKIRAKYLWLARYHNETVLRFNKGKRIPVFKDELPSGKPAF